MCKRVSSVFQTVTIGACAIGAAGACGTEVTGQSRAAAKAAGEKTIDVCRSGPSENHNVAITYETEREDRVAMDDQFQLLGYHWVKADAYPRADEDGTCMLEAGATVIARRSLEVDGKPWVELEYIDASDDMTEVWADSCWRCPLNTTFNVPEENLLRPG